MKFIEVETYISKAVNMVEWIAIILAFVGAGTMDYNQQMGIEDNPHLVVTMFVLTTVLLMCALYEYAVDKFYDEVKRKDIKG